MKKPVYQRSLTYFLWILAGFLFLGSILDTIVNSIELITPGVTYSGTMLLALVAFLFLAVRLTKAPIPWVTEEGHWVRLKAIGIKPVWALAGVLIALWMPRFISIPNNRESAQDINLELLAATVIANEEKRKVLSATAAAIETQQASEPHQSDTATDPTQIALTTELANLHATNQALATQSALIQSTLIPITRVPDTATRAPTSVSNKSIEPDQLILNYYTAINERNYEQSWSMLSDTFKAQNNSTGFSSYTAWWDRVGRVDVYQVEITERADYTATIVVSLQYNMKDGTSESSTVVFKLITNFDTDSWLINE